MTTCSEGTAMISIGHYGATEISNKIARTKAHWKSLREKILIQQHLLDDALQAQQYYSSAQEVESWIKEREPTVSNGDYGKDEDSVQVSLCRTGEPRGTER